jgi:hypothetical protein
MRDTSKWAFVLARTGDGWALSIVLGAAQFVRPDAGSRPLEAALDDLRLLAELLENDELTGRLLKD